MRITLSSLFVLVVLAGGCTNTGGPGASDVSDSSTWAEGQSYSDSAIGLSKTSVFDTATPDEVRHNEAEDQEGKVLSRPYDISPPRIPHAIRDMEPISREQNDCVECHEGSSIPKSHYVDYRNTPDKQGTSLYGARYNCTMCHVPVTDAKPVVKSLFNRSE